MSSDRDYFKISYNEYIALINTDYEKDSSFDLCSISIVEVIKTFHHNRSDLNHSRISIYHRSNSFSPRFEQNLKNFLEA